ncbi:bifunctional DNA primase/polymerase (plasmid) [Alicyclobacillus curvatus]|nr:bifunctional DNA primase/polymerase [Alicyclobacillus curvatus]
MMTNEKAVTETAPTNITSSIVSDMERHERALLRIPWAIFPVKFKDKVPACANGRNDATTDWEDYQKLCKGPHNIGLATGEESDVWVLDVDVRKDGDKSFHHLIDKYGAFPYTVQSRTQSGGFHIFFRWDPKRPVKSRSDILPGIDTRGRGGYAVLPPSKGLEGKYEWIVPPIRNVVANAPEWLYEVLGSATQSPHGVADFQEVRSQRLKELQDIAAGVSHGARNSSAARLTGYLMRHIDAVVAERLLRAWDTLNTPPLGSELDNVIDSIARSELRRRGWSHE